MDRTAEFLSFVAAAGGGRASASAPAAYGGSDAAASGFTRAAAQVGRDLHLTAAKVQQLTKSAWGGKAGLGAGWVQGARAPRARARVATLTPPLSRARAVVRRRGVFDPSGGAGGGFSEVDRLTASIKADLTRVTPALDALQGVIDARKAEAARTGAAAGGRRLPPMAPGGVAGGGGGGGAGASASASAGSGSGGGGGGSGAGASVDPVSTVQGLSHSDSVLSGLKGQLLGVAQSLRGVVAARGETVARTAERRQMFGGAGALGGALEGAAGGGGGGGDAVISVAPAGFAADEAFAAVTQAQLSRDPELQYLSARARDVAGLEATISELGTLFGRLASVVAEQGGAVERIDADLEAAAGDMNRGAAQLERAWAAAKSNRGLALRVLGVLVTFAVFYSVVLV
jgi:hypothetical protein